MPPTVNSQAKCVITRSITMITVRPTTVTHRIVNRGVTVQPLPPGSIGSLRFHLVCPAPAESTAERNGTKGS